MWVGTYPEVLTDADLNAEVSEFARDKIRARINNPELEAKLVPTSYGFCTYRVPLENGYCEVYARDNVTLVDVGESPIESISEKGLLVGGREYPLDVLVLATGFDADTGVADADEYSRTSWPIPSRIVGARYCVDFRSAGARISQFIHYCRSASTVHRLL